jgi:CRISPR-associated protein Cas1
MGDRILDFSEEAAYLSSRIGLLVIERKDKPEVTMPFEDIAVVISSNPQVRFTNAALSGLAQACGVFIVCNEKHLPVGMLLPIAVHSTQGERFIKQANASAPICKQLWKQVASEKIKNQGKLLKELYGHDEGLIKLSKKVRSGDTENLEGQASRRYWPKIFDDKSFSRDREAEDQNKFLNYGYTVLRAIVARAICGAGLHPSLGIHHHNRYDSYCLADDLMEPFRPIVDKAVVQLVKDKGTETPMDKETKSALIGALTARFDLEGESRTLFDIITRTASSLAQVFEGKADELVLPEIFTPTKQPEQE